MKAFTGCMKDKIIKNKYKPNECLVLSLNDCKTLFKEYFEEFLTFVDLKLIPEDNQQEMIDTFKTSFDFAILLSKNSLPILLKGQLISKCPYEKSVWTKIATKIFPRFLFLKFTTSRLTQKESLCSVCKKIDSVL